MAAFGGPRLSGLRALAYPGSGPFIAGTAFTGFDLAHDSATSCVVLSRLMPKAVEMSKGWFVALLLVLAVTGAQRAQAQANFDRPGGDYDRVSIPSGDPAACALLCERDRRCQSWSFAYPNGRVGGALCWLKSSVPPRVPDRLSVSGVRGAGVVEPRNSQMEVAIDRYGGDYRNFELPSAGGDQACQAACKDDNKCRAWTFARAGYTGRAARCYLKDEVKPPRRRPGLVSGVVR